MGTRHMIAVVLDGEYKIAQYGQWDGYPSGQGRDICNFIQQKLNRTKFKKALKECRWATEEEVNEGLLSLDIKSGWMNMEEASRFKTMFPEWSRDAGADILELVQDHGKRNLQNNLSFASDSLFCEWAYVLDMDNEVLEIYKGFNKSPVPKGERFANIKREKGGEYYPVCLIGKLNFNEAIPEMMSQFEGRDEEETEDGATDATT